MGTPADLEARLAASESRVLELQDELEETNRGVVALYAELDEQAEKLRDATELKSRFLAYMSHEFRTPIASIQSLAALLLARVDGPLTPGQEKQVTFINTTAGEFSDMVNDLLDLAKIDAGRVAIDAAWFDMVDLFSALRGMFKPLLINPDVLLIFEEPHDIPPVYTDNRKLSQILRNFISNALKFTTSGTVRVSVTRSGEDTIVFSVVDTGIGIAPEAHAGLFQDFVQVDSPLQRRLRGTGLGLSLSKKLAGMLGGTIAFSSALGSGSTFSISLPIQAEAPNQVTPPPERNDARGVSPDPAD